MELEEYYQHYHVDISTQIENTWKTDTILGVVKNSRRFSIKLKGRDKEIIKKRFVLDADSDSNKQHNKKVIAIIYSYLLYKSLCEFPEANHLLLCRDVRPERYVIHYLQKVSNFFNNSKIFGSRKIQFRKRENKVQKRLPKSLAGKYVRKVYQGKLPANKIINNDEIKELIEVISKIM